VSLRRFKYFAGLFLGMEREKWGLRNRKKKKDKEIISMRLGQGIQK